MKPLSALVPLSAALVTIGCSNPALNQLGADVLSATGYVSDSQAQGLFSAGKKLVKSQEKLTPEQEYYLGRAVSAKLLATYPPTSKGEISPYLNQVGGAIVSVSDLPETFGGYHFTVINSPHINAMSAPGGFVYLSSGFLQVIPDEDALAAVIAHEVAHVVKQHGVNAISNANLFAALTEASQQGVSIAASQTSSPVDLGPITSVFSESVSGVADKLLNTGFDRRQEYEADLYAANLLSQAGYDPNALVRVLEILHSASSSDNAGWFATHPDPMKRIEQLKDDFDFPAPQSSNEAREKRFKRAFAR